MIRYFVDQLWSIRRLLCIGACSAAFLSPLPAGGEPLRVLFVGNSFTIGGTSSVPVIFTRLATAGGHETPATVMRAVGGQDFQFHETDATSRSVIASQAWTHVVLQNYSTEPTHIGSVADHMNYGNLLYGRVMANHPLTKVVLFETWSRSMKHALISGISTPTTFASTAEMQSELRENYAALALHLNAANPLNPPVVVAPVGDAWENAGGLLGDTHPLFASLHTTDNYHGNNNGYYLAAAVIYATVYQASPEGLHLNTAVSSLNLNLTVPAAVLERHAWDTVTGNTGIRFLTQPQPVSVSPGQGATFTATVRGAVPYQVQWYRNGEPVPGATALTLTVPGVSPGMNGDLFTARVTNARGTVSSEAAALAVTMDTSPPVAGTPSLVDALTVTVPFDEALSPGAAAGAGNFTVVHRGRVVPVLSSVLAADGRSVTLNLGAGISSGFAVGISSAVGDVSGNLPEQGSVVISKATASSPAEIFIDFGAAATRTTTDSGRTWNNVDAPIGTSNTGRLDPLVGSDGVATGARLEMVRRFNGTNSDGTTSSGIYPASASRDTLYGNTETFGGLANVFPAFRIAGLDLASAYQLTFYASRNATDNRTSVYTVSGATTSATILNAAGNTGNTTNLSNVMPSAAGELVIEISPHASNNNANHFTYLGVLVISPASSAAPMAMRQPVPLHGRMILDWTGAGSLETSTDLNPPWLPVPSATAPPHTEPMSGPRRFYRLSAPAP